MKFTHATGWLLAVWASLSAAAAIPEVEVLGTRTTDTDLVDSPGSPVLDARDSQCTNGPLTRACWSNGYSIATDFDQKFPSTGNTVTYNLEITNTTCNPDGSSPGRVCLLINGQYPGPVLTATWGDTMVVNVKNSMQDNGTGIHFHGVRQYNSVGSDGVSGVTECALAPGSSKTYKFQVTQFGSSWYHAHFSSQYGDGVVGSMVFNGPASANYDIDLGPYVISDWYYSTAFQIQRQTLYNLQAQSPPPSANNILINGTMTSANGGAYNKVTITAGKKYRLRLMNVAADNFIRVSLDGHNMTVMASDFIPINPFPVSSLLIGIGQRYDVVINANATAGNYWFRASVAGDCLSSNNGQGLAIWTYSSVSQANPSSTAQPQGSTCQEPALSPYWKQAVPTGSFTSTLQTMNVNLTKAQVMENGDAVFVWALDTSSMDVAWDNPTMSYLMAGNTSYPERYNVYPTVAEGSWNYWIVQTVQGLPPVPHPIHLHGHDFFVLGQGGGVFPGTASSLNFNTPPRRDTAILPGGGWLAMAFNSNNPGAWLMHCHIAWHVSEGLSVQFLESPSSIVFPDSSSYNQVCNAWKAYQPSMKYPKDDSGM